jgi:hypothetical protein
MQSLYRIAINGEGQYSVDVFNERRAFASKWRTYWNITPSSISRLRRMFLKHKKCFYVSHEWSNGRWRMFRDYRRSLFGGPAGLALSPYLVNLETNSEQAGL